MITLDWSSGIDLEYLAEGAANIVYKIIPRPTTPSIAADSGFYDYELAVTETAPLQISPDLEGKLVRLRKATTSKCSVLESYQRYQKAIVPLFPRAEDRVEHTLFHATSALISELNQQLKLMENQQSRPKKRCGTYLDDNEDHGLLVTDMTCSNPSSVNFQCFEFKTKWLVQSPSAPPNAIRCRTCALRHFRRAQSHSDSSEGHQHVFCPLGLVSNKRLVVESTVTRMFGSDSHDIENNSLETDIRQRLTDILHENHLLGQLRDSQFRLDRHGLISSGISEDLLTAMTLRDCTLFIKIPASAEGKTEARLGDLDFKSPENGKKEYWRDQEEKLIEQGWYTGTEKPCVKTDGICLLANSEQK